jgi:uncharacterized protein YfaQ (DUF2300 family)
MKGISILLIAAGLFVSVQASAQCSGSAAKSAGASCCAKGGSASTAAADVEKRVAEDGTVTYFRKETSAQTGITTYSQVSYNQHTNSYDALAVNTPDGNGKSDQAAQQPAACAGKSAAGATCCAKPGTEAESAEKTTANGRSRRSNAVKLASSRS